MRWVICLFLCGPLGLAAARAPKSAVKIGIDVLIEQKFAPRNGMQACGQHHVPFMVLDRPNPIGGNRVEGNILDMKFKSGVGPFPIPYCHGLTVGELAKMINDRRWTMDDRRSAALDTLGGAKC